MSYTLYTIKKKKKCDGGYDLHTVESFIWPWYYGYHHSPNIKIVEEALQSGMLSVKYVICTVFKKTVPNKKETVPNKNHSKP